MDISYEKGSFVRMQGQSIQIDRDLICFSLCSSQDAPEKNPF